MRALPSRTGEWLMADGDILDGVLTRLVPTTEGDLDLLAQWFASLDFVEHWGGLPISRAEVAEKYVGRQPAACRVLPCTGKEHAGGLRAVLAGRSG